MKKIMFNDKYGLTQAVLEGQKTMTRRVVPEKVLEAYYDYDDFVNSVAPSGIPCFREWEEDFFLRRSPYKVGDIVAVAQNLKDMGYNGKAKPGGHIWGLDHSAAWTNKMFVCAKDCIHQIRITNVRIERLQDISDEDVYKEGFFKQPVNNGWGNYTFHYEACIVYYDHLGRTKTIQNRYPKEAYETLINKVSGKGTWERNPYVFVYEFELVK